MNFRQLRYFVVVAEELHFGRAASKLHMAQPPLSMQIKRLEETIGVLLFERTKRQVKLTPAGSVLYKEAQQILAQVASAQKKVQQAARGELGDLSVAFVSSAMYSVLPPWISRFRQQYPSVTLHLQERTTMEQIESLLAQQIDIGYVRPPVLNESIDSRCVWQENLVVALPVDHSLSKRRRISVRDLSSVSFILFPRALATDLYDNIISFCQQAGFSPDIVQTAAQLQTLLGLVAAGLGVAIVPAATQKLQREGVCYKPFVEATPTTELRVVWRADDKSATVANFLALQAACS